LGTATGVTATVMDWNNYQKDPSPSNLIRVGVDVALVLARDINPVWLVGIGIADATGLTDRLYQQFDNKY